MSATFQPLLTTARNPEADRAYHRAMAYDYGFAVSLSLREWPFPTFTDAQADVLISLARRAARHALLAGPRKDGK